METKIARMKKIFPELEEKRVFCKKMTDVYEKVKDAFLENIAAETRIKEEKAAAAAEADQQQNQ